MITLTLTVPMPDAIVAAGYTQIQVLRSTTKTAAGPYGVINPAVTLQSGVTSYAFVDVSGTYADWYETVFYNGTSQSEPSAPQAGWLSDLCNGARDILGVSTTEIADTQIQGFAYLPSALAKIRLRLPNPAFDTLIASGGDMQALCLSALAHLVAALLCPRMQMQVMDREQFDRYQYQRNRALDWQQTQQILMAKYEELVSQAANETAANPDVYFAPVQITGPTASGADTSGGLIGFDNSSVFENPLLPYTGQMPD